MTVTGRAFSEHSPEAPLANIGSRLPIVRMLEHIHVNHDIWNDDIKVQQQLTAEYEAKSSNCCLRPARVTAFAGFDRHCDECRLSQVCFPPEIRGPLTIGAVGSVGSAVFHAQCRK